MFELFIFFEIVRALFKIPEEQKRNKHLCNISYIFPQKENRFLFVFLLLSCKETLQAILFLQPSMTTKRLLRENIRSIDVKSFDPAKLSMGELEGNERSPSESAPLTYDGGDFFLQTKPLRLQKFFEPLEKKNGGGKCKLLFGLGRYDQPGSSDEGVFRMFDQIQQFAQNQTYERDLLNLADTNSIGIVERMFEPVIKNHPNAKPKPVPRKKGVKPDSAPIQDSPSQYPPRLGLNVKLYPPRKGQDPSHNEISMSLFDDKNQPISHQETWRLLHSQGVELTLLLHIESCWFLNGRFGLSVSVVQARRVPTPVNWRRECVMHDDNETEPVPGTKSETSYTPANPTASSSSSKEEYDGERCSKKLRSANEDSVPFLEEPSLS